MAGVKIASFNVWGIDGKDVGNAVRAAAGVAGPNVPEAIAIGFQEVWFGHQRDHVLDAWQLDRTIDASMHYVGLDGYSSSAHGWKCLVPNVGKAGIPGLRSLELGSGLALCVRGPIIDAYFHKFQGGYVPDSFAKKGMIAARIAPAGLRQRAIICTHFHDFSNDAGGGARRVNLEQLAGTVNWINQHWRVPIVIVGDFNIDARDAYLNNQPTINHTLYRKLTQLGKPPGQFWHDMNAQFNAFKPEPTQSDEDGAIDIQLLSGPAGKSNLHFERFRFFRDTDPQQVAFSDHRLVCSTWSEP